ncbi:SUKH-3 domain-containing protein [Kitasatospora sp. NPDC088134]|uniref:SUKH-3 domain-containing protein n=1 Tax=Kitasatospora sp. NPDC088134 TaxID=3364071 RepID=UPI0037F757B3
MGELTARAREGLRGSGWFEGRQVPIDAALDAWREIDRVPGPAALAAAREFTGLRLTHPHYWTKTLDDFTDIDPVAAVGRTWLPVLTGEYEAAAGEPLSPLGLTRYGMQIFLGASGAVYGGHSPYLGTYGDSFHAFLNLLHSDRRPTTLSGT